MALCEIQQNYAGTFRSGSMRSPKRGGFQLQAAFYNMSVCEWTCLEMKGHHLIISQIHKAPEDPNNFASKWVYFSVEGCFDTHVFDGSLVPIICYHPLPVWIILSFHRHSCAGWHRFLFRKWENGWVRGSTRSFCSFIPPRGSRDKVKLQSVRIAEEQSAMERL